jgi:hypothetical protein
MRWRPGHLAFLLFQAIWLNVVLPGHTRGIVTLAGASCSACATQAGDDAGRAAANKHCCSASPASHQARHDPTPRQKANCAICAFAARITPPPPISVIPQHAGPAIALTPPLRQAAVSLELIPTYYGNGPPPAAA